jgi:DNA-binding CsgD family transcriptional regulator
MTAEKSPRKGTLAQARGAYRRAEFSAAAATLDALATNAGWAPEAALLRARIFLKREPAAALAHLARTATAFTRPQDRAEAEMLQGVTYARLGDAVAAESCFANAERLLLAGTALSRELTYQRAAAAWIRRDLDAASQFLEMVDAAATGDLQLEALVLRGAIAAARGDVVGQGAVLLEALGCVRASNDRSVLHWASIVSQIANLAHELPGTSLRDAAFAELGAVPWTSDLTELRFATVRSVAWRRALDGDEFNAFRLLKEAAALAPTDAWRVTAFCDRAYFATALGERRWAEQELSDAHELAARVEWNALDGEERFALSELAELFAPRDAALALSYVGRYKDSGKRYARTLSSHQDLRVDAMEAYSFGVVQLALGRRKEAARLLREAWDVYDALGYDWRAGRAARDLLAATGDDAWQARAAAKLAPYPRSWLAMARHAANFGESPELAALTPAQLAVYRLLMRGLSTAQIAAEQSRSEFTVRNHIKAIFKAIGVNSRPELLARAHEMPSAPKGPAWTNGAEDAPAVLVVRTAKRGPTRRRS